MRNHQWRNLLLLRFSIPTSRIKPLGFQVRALDPENPLKFSSLFTRNLHQSWGFPSNLRNPRVVRSFSTEPASEQRDPDQNHVALTNILSKSSDLKEIRREMEGISLVISHDMVLETLGNLEGNPEIAWRFFNLVLEVESGKLSSKGYNLMLGILGRKEYVNEFWGLVELMKKKGYGVSKRAFYKASEGFEKDGMVGDLEKLKGMFVRPDESSVKRVGSKVCKVIRENEWGDEVKRGIEDLGVSWSNDLVEMVIAHLKLEPMKALMFFWWVEESSEFSHDKLTYNAMVKVLSREDCIEKFWRVVNDMKEAGFEMELETYSKAMDRFYKRTMMKDVVDLYEFMMSSETKPKVQDTDFLLRKIVVGKELDMGLFSRVVKIFARSGNALTESNLDGILKSLNSVSRLQECDKILKAMEEGGFVPTRVVYEKLIIRLCITGRFDESFQFLNEMVNEKQLRPRQTTYQILIERLLARRNMKKAMSLIGLMKDQGYPPFVEPFINHISTHGTADDAINFLSEMTVKRFPSTPVCVRMLEAFFEAGRQGDAQECFSKLPSSIRNHADVLDLLCAWKLKNAGSATTVTA